MSSRFIVISAVFTALSFAGVEYGSELSFSKLKSEGIIGKNLIHLDKENANHVVELVLGSYTTTWLLANFLINAFILLNLCLKTVFFSELYPAEIRKLVECLINYVMYKGTFLPMIVPPTIYQAGLWSSWMIVLCSLKMFQTLARDRLERLNASPSARPWTYGRVYSALLLVFLVDLFWIRLCLMIYKTHPSSMLLLLFYEPVSIACETLQAILLHGFQLLDIWLHHSACNNTDSGRSKLFDTLAAGSLMEWKWSLIRNLGFLLDMATSFTALGHYLHIWWLHGIAFHLVDAVLFLNIRVNICTLLSAIINRVRAYIRLRTALGALHAALPDATTEELLAYDDECAICREPMAKAKKLNCKHLFHLACLRSWLDQGLAEMYTCPTCRKPLFVGRPQNEASFNMRETSSEEPHVSQIGSGLDQPNAGRHAMAAGLFPNQTPNMEGISWRGAAGLDSTWLHSWPNQGVDGAGPSTAIRSVGLGRVQMMMRHLASVGENAQNALEDTAWSLWPMNTSQASGSGSRVPPNGRLPGGSDNLHMRNAPRFANDNLANILAMAETVREVLPHIPDDIIFQDLQRTNSVSVTVNNLLQM
ncbi:E3 ubiquitin protein ligase RIN2 isoform X2 [Prosopis cineraria]|uniref:E3 ubiquitin protein ligase RIN2 isoform X1 n=1 Tax=Prosopis cineraria TaxID=364024 RepID=UPI002410A843|nr:E3 ubiquitin protein ligase RIN2 isoform X1 [Prosopis cineraria]XP_054815901.1 E3 ubiquitin protein ligase RIN2 isoform X2 [Prosopis cineraria]